MEGLRRGTIKDKDRELQGLIILLLAVECLVHAEGKKSIECGRASVEAMVVVSEKKSKDWEVHLTILTVEPRGRPKAIMTKACKYSTTMMTKTTHHWGMRGLTEATGKIGLVWHVKILLHVACKGM